MADGDASLAGPVIVLTLDHAGADGLMKALLVSQSPTCTLGTGLLLPLRFRAFADPVFVLCNGRSGSTLLRFLLDAHPDLACSPEIPDAAITGIRETTAA